MTTQSRKRRGMRTQKNVAAYLAERGWPYAESAGAGRSGSDVTGTPDIAVEVKARTGFDPLAWVRQAAEAADGRLPFAVMRCNGQGEDAGKYIALIRLEDLVPVLRDAGYGDAGAALTVPCDGQCGSPEPHDAHLAPGALQRLTDNTAVSAS